MWDVVSIVAAVVVILLLFEILDIAEKLKDRLFDRVPRRDLEKRVTKLEEQFVQFEQKLGSG